MLLQIIFAIKTQLSVISRTMFKTVYKYYLKAKARSYPGVIAV